MEITVNIPAIDRLAEAITGLARKLPATEMQEKLPVAETKTPDPATSIPKPSPTVGRADSSGAGNPHNGHARCAGTRGTCIGAVVYPGTIIPGRASVSRLGPYG